MSCRGNDHEWKTRAQGGSAALRKCFLLEMAEQENSPGHLTVSVLFRHHQELKYDQLMMKCLQL